MDGIINFYKPKGMTSHDAVSFIRKIFNMKRVGHSGTLDPNVAGVLPICIGKATRVAEYLLEADKEYIGELTLGYATDTQDIDGSIIKKSNKKVSNEEIFQTFETFKGEISQIPPMYSAVKHKGKKLYDLARAGITIERNPRLITIHDLRIIGINDKSIIFTTKCSKGTYIRTLCNDIGEALGTYGHMSFLMRTNVANFSINNSLSIDYLKNINKGDLNNILYPLDYALVNFTDIIIDDSLYTKVINGVPIPVELQNTHTSSIKVYCRDIFIGIGEIINRSDIKILKMKKVLV